MSPRGSKALAEPGGICVSARVQEDAAGQARPRLRRHRRAAAQEHRAAGPGLPRGHGRPPGNAAGQPPACALPDKPSIAVLPFANMSGDPEQEYFADGMVEEIITALSRIRWLFVIARNSSFTYKGRAVDVKQVGRELGVRYVLEGSVRKAGGRVRITAQLIDATNGAHLWADRFDGVAGRCFRPSGQDRFERRRRYRAGIAGGGDAPLGTTADDDLNAYDLYLRALAAFVSGNERTAGCCSRIYSSRRSRCDPLYGPALALAAVCHLRLISEGWAEEPETNRRKSIDLARQALQIGERTTLASWPMPPLVLAQFGEDISAHDRAGRPALTLNPSFARGWFRSGLIRIYAGEPDLAIEHFETSLRLSPRDRIGTHSSVDWHGTISSNASLDEAASNLLLSHCRRIPALRPHTALSPRATLIWGG